MLLSLTLIALVAAAMLSGIYLLTQESIEQQKAEKQLAAISAVLPAYERIADPETVEAMHIAELTHGSTDLPIFMMCDTFNRVVWFRQGYSINMSGQIMDVIMQLMGLE